MAKNKDHNRCSLVLHEFELMKAVESFLDSRTYYQSRIRLAEVRANILATEGYVCAGIGFTKYLN